MVDLFIYARQWFATNHLQTRAWNALFGVPFPEACRLYDLVEGKITPTRFCWILYFLKVYPTFDAGAAWARTSAKTFRRVIVEGISTLSIHLPEVGINFY